MDMMDTFTVEAFKEKYPKEISEAAPYKQNNHGKKKNLFGMSSGWNQLL